MTQTKIQPSLTSSYSRSYIVFLFIFLGMLSAFGPFLTDMYLPTLPTMVGDFNTTESLVQFSLTIGMIGLAVGQILFGPLSQKLGRKPILIATMALFIIAAVASIFSTDIYFFLICRLAQGFGGAGGLVLSRSIATDCYRGRELAKTMAIIGAINGIAPAFAPVIGGLVSKAVGWQGIFVILSGLGVVLLLMSFIFKETLAKDKRETGSIWSTFSDYGKVLRIRRFVLLILAYGFAMGSLFAYISAAPFIVQSDFGFNELGFAIIFGVNSVLIGVGSGLALRFKSLDKAMMIGGVGMLVTSVLQLVSALTMANFVGYEVTTVITLIFLGMVFTTSTSMAMDQGRQYTGAAAAIVGAIGFLFGGIVSPMVGLGETQIAAATLLVICAAIVVAMVAILRKTSK
jgi:DHA1 family bicyclomycin/chloramphenicol resistance-like MFS transporter